MTMADRIGCDRRYSSRRLTTSLLPPRETSSVQIRLSPTSTHYAAAANSFSIDEPPRFKVGDSRSRGCQITAAWRRFIAWSNS